MPDDDTSDSNSNPFIRFKHHVDANVHAGLNTIAGISRTTTTTNTSSSSPPSPDNNTLSHNPSDPTAQPHPNNPNEGSTMTTTTSVFPSNTIPILGPADPALESRIALLSSTALPEATAAARALFLSRSAYSPLRLHRELGVALGCHPVPKDLDLDSSSSPSRPPVLARDDVETGLSSWRREDGHAGHAGREREGGDAGEFGWLEAYEDLLRVSSGLGLADLDERRKHQGQRERCAVQGLGRSGWGWGWGWGWQDGSEEMGWLGRHGSSANTTTWWWMERLRRQGLWEAAFPVWDPEAGYRSPRTMEEWVARRREEEAARGRWAEEGRRWKEHWEERERRREEQEKQAEDAWREVEGEWARWFQEAQRDAKRELDDVHREVERARDALEDAAGRGSGFLGGIEGVVKALGKVLSDEVGHGKGSEEKQRREDADADKGGNPQTEGDLYSAVRSAFHESERSLSNLFKSISDGWREGSLQSAKPASPPKTETVEVVENGFTKKTTKTEFVDERGNTHNKVETTWTDEDGRVVMRQVQSSTGRSERWEKTIETGSDESPKQEREPVEEPKEHKKEGGWFWK